MDTDLIKSIAIPSKRKRGGERTGTASSPLAPAEGRLKLAASQTARPPAKLAPQPSHVYSIGQQLRMLGGGNRWARVESLCRVVVLLPYEGGSLMYRVRSEAENYERVVAEIDLQPIP